MSVSHELVMNSMRMGGFITTQITTYLQGKDDSEESHRRDTLSLLTPLRSNETGLESMLMAPVCHARSEHLTVLIYEVLLATQEARTALYYFYRGGN